MIDTYGTLPRIKKQVKTSSSIRRMEGFSRLLEFTKQQSQPILHPNPEDTKGNISGEIDVCHSLPVLPQFTRLEDIAEAREGDLGGLSPTTEEPELGDSKMIHGNLDIQRGNFENLNGDMDITEMFEAVLAEVEEDGNEVQTDYQVSIGTEKSQEAQISLTDPTSEIGNRFTSPDILDNKKHDRNNLEMRQESNSLMSDMNHEKLSLLEGTHIDEGMTVDNNNSASVEMAEEEVVKHQHESCNVEQTPTRESHVCAAPEEDAQALGIYAHWSRTFTHVASMLPSSNTLIVLGVAVILGVAYKFYSW